MEVVSLVGLACWRDICVPRLSPLMNFLRMSTISRYSSFKTVVRCPVMDTFLSSIFLATESSSTEELT